MAYHHIYIGRENDMRVIVQHEGIHADLSTVQRMDLLFPRFVLSSDERPDIFDWSQGDGRAIFKLGRLNLKEGKYLVRLIVYDVEHPNGVVFDNYHIYFHNLPKALRKSVTVHAATDVSASLRVNKRKTVLIRNKAVVEAERHIQNVISSKGKVEGQIVFTKDRKLDIASRAFFEWQKVYIFKAKAGSTVSAKKTLYKGCEASISDHGAVHLSTTKAINLSSYMTSDSTFNGSPLKVSDMSVVVDAVGVFDWDVTYTVTITGQGMATGEKTLSHVLSASVHGNAGMHCDSMNKTIDLKAAAVTDSGNTAAISLLQDKTTDIISDGDVSGDMINMHYNPDILGIVLINNNVKGGEWAYVNNLEEVIAKPDEEYFNNHPIYSGINPNASFAGQVMVGIPKFYYHKSILPSYHQYANKQCWWISPVPYDGFNVHPAFMKEGVVMDKFYVGKYQGYVDSDDCLCSKPGVKPTTNELFAKFEECVSNLIAAHPHSPGFCIWNIYMWAAIQYLFLFEMSTMDSQTAVGEGYVNAGTNGKVKNVDDELVATASYRGIVGLWGNIWQMCPGLKIDPNGILHIWDKNGNKTFINTGVTIHNNAHYAKAFQNNEGTDFSLASVFIRAYSTSTESNALAPDKQYANSNCDLSMTSGSIHTKESAGLWYLTFTKTTEKYKYDGTRLAYI